MPFQTKPSSDMVYDLINEANPTLPAQVAAASVRLGVPAVFAGGSWPNPNTTITLTGVPGNTDFIGRRAVTYRRWDLSALYRGMTLTVKKHSEANLGGGANTVVFTVHQLLADINVKYGIHLTTDDVENANILRGSTQEGGLYVSTVNVVAKTTSLGFRGQFALKWIEGKPNLAEMITVQEIPGRRYPGGNDFSGAHKDIVSTAAFGIDFSSAIKGAYPTMPDNPVNITLPASQVWFDMVNACLQIVNARAGTAYQVSGTTNYKTAVNDFAGMSLVSAHTDDAAYPEANSADFNRMLIIKVPDDCTWAAGTMLFHYNYPL